MDATTREMVKAVASAPATGSTDGCAGTLFAGFISARAPGLGRARRSAPRAASRLNPTARSCAACNPRPGINA